MYSLGGTGINPQRFNSLSRFGRGFYLSEIPDTTLAELAHHKATGVGTIRYNFNAKSANILDFTQPEVAEAWGYLGGNITSHTREMGDRARDAGFNVIRFPSERGEGANIVVLDDFGYLLEPQMIVPTPGINSNDRNKIGR